MTKGSKEEWNVERKAGTVAGDGNEENESRKVKHGMVKPV